MSDALWIAAATLVVGLVVGSAVGASRRLRVGEQHADASAARLESRLEVQAAEMRRLADAAASRDLAAEQLREGFDAARRTLDELRLREQERRASDDDHRKVVQRLATVLAGGSSKGRSGENVLREHLSEFPPSMLVTDFRVNGKVVEFGLLLPDGRRMPIDSKWSALAELEALEASIDSTDRDACARAVEKAVVLRTKEISQYLDPALTSPVAVAAIPDAAYGALKRAHAEAFAKGVVVVPYSCALPIVLFLYSLVQRYGDAAEVQSSLAEVSSVLDAMGAVVENRFARAASMLSNGTEELRSQLGKARGSIARAHGPGALELDDSTRLDDGRDEGMLTVVG